MLHLVSIWEEVRNVPNERKTEALVRSHFETDPCGVRIGLDAADGKNLEIFSPSIGTPLLERGLIDEVDLHVLPRSSAPAPTCTTSRAGPCASCRTWVGDDPDAVTNFPFRAT